MSAVSPIAPNIPADKPVGRLITCPVDELRPHPSIVRLHLAPSLNDLSDAILRQDQAFWEPLTITQDRYILAGHAKLRLALNRGDRVLTCLQIEVSEEEALLWLIQKHQRSSSLNDFSRILLALELEPWFKARARFNQQLGGQIKGSSNLAEADRIDVRSQIAAAAGVSVGNVSKVKSLMAAALPDVLEALRDGEFSIHRASTWLRHPEKQLEELRLHRNRHGVKRIINSLQARHRLPSRNGDSGFDVSMIASALAAMKPERRLSVLVGQIDHPGAALLLSSGLMKALEMQGELSL